MWHRARHSVRQITRLAWGIEPNFYINVLPGTEAARLSWSPDGRKILFAFGGWRYVHGVPSGEMLPDSVAIHLTNEVVQQFIAAAVDQAGPLVAFRFSNTANNTSLGTLLMDARPVHGAEEDVCVARGAGASRGVAPFA